MNEQRIAEKLVRDMTAGVGVRDVAAIVNKAGGRIDLVLRALRAVVWDTAYEKGLDEAETKRLSKMLQETEGVFKKALSW